MSANTVARGVKPVNLTRILALALVPLVTAGFLAWGLQDPNERLDTVTAAIVNRDEPVTVGEQLVPLGRLLAGELMGDEKSNNYKWVLTDSIDAKTGLDEGRYASVVTIPKDFSARATSTSLGPDKAEQAEVTVVTRDRGGLVDNVLTKRITGKAAEVVNRELSEKFLQNVFGGMNELSTGLGKLSEGADQLVGGAGQLAEGGAKLSGGTSQLAGGASELANGTGKLSEGANGLIAGVQALVAGARAMQGGLQEVSTKTGQLADGAGQYVGGVNTVLQPIVDGDSALVKSFTDLRQAIISGVIPIPDPAQKAELVARLTALIDGFAASQQQLQALIGAGNEVAGGVQLLGGGVQQLAEKSGLLTQGVEGVLGGANQLAGGIQSAAAGASQLAGAAGEISQGAAGLADGLQKSSAGVQQLAGGIGEAQAGIPKYSRHQSENLARVAVTPIAFTGDSDAFFSGSADALFVVLGLWIGALVMLLVVWPLWSRTKTAARAMPFILFRSALPAIVLGAVQGLVLAVALPYFTGVGAASFLPLTFFVVVAGVCFALFVQGLVALMGGWGRLIALLFALITLVAGFVSTAPEFLRTVAAVNPLGQMFAGMQSVTLAEPGLDGSVLALLLWGVAGLCLTSFAIARERRP